MTQQDCEDAEQVGVASESVHEHPLFAKSSIHDSVKVKIAPVHSAFRCRMTFLLDLMGFAGRRLNRNTALEVPRFLRVLPTTV
jgi:hypothetical protein